MAVQQVAPRIPRTDHGERTAHDPTATCSKLRAEILSNSPSVHTSSWVSVDAIMQLKRQNTDDTHLGLAHALAGVMRADMAVIEDNDGFEALALPIVADIDAGFGNDHATYLPSNDPIKAGACCLQIENQVFDARQSGHKDGKVTVSRAYFIEKLRAGRLAFEDLGVDDGLIVARPDSLGAGRIEESSGQQSLAAGAVRRSRHLKAETTGTSEKCNSLGDGRSGERQRSPNAAPGATQPILMAGL